MKLDKQQEAQSAVAGDSISSVGVPINVKDYSPSEVFTEPLPVSGAALFFFTFEFLSTQHQIIKMTLAALYEKSQFQNSTSISLL